MIRGVATPAARAGRFGAAEHGESGQAAAVDWLEEEEGPRGGGHDGGEMTGPACLWQAIWQCAGGACVVNSVEYNNLKVFAFDYGAITTGTVAVFRAAIALDTRASCAFRSQLQLTGEGSGTSGGQCSPEPHASHHRGDHGIVGDGGGGGGEWIKVMAKAEEAEERRGEEDEEDEEVDWESRYNYASDGDGAKIYSTSKV